MKAIFILIIAAMVYTLGSNMIQHVKASKLAHIEKIERAINNI
jgi:hypothetical protein